MMWKRQKAVMPITCQACHTSIEIGQTIINHHISYYPEKTIQIHAGCHTQIHWKTKFLNLLPDLRQQIRWYRKKGVIHKIDDLYHFPIIIHSWETGFLTPERIEEMKEQMYKRWAQEAYEKSIRFPLRV